jgi:YegS/Rv2252/BmrU family lipid kinase
MSTKIILNPYSNRWGARKQASLLRQLLIDMGYDFDFVEMARPGHGIELASEAVAQGYDTVVAAGGDGTINEVVRGLVMDGQTAGARLGVIPLGSANDYAYQLGIPTDLQAACQLLVRAEHVRQLDLGRADDWVFMNDFIIGLGAEVNMEAAKITWLRGDLLYVAGALKAILKGQWPRVALRWDGGEMAQKGVLMVYVGIGYRTGGVYFLTPDAQQDDGLLDVVVADARSRLGVFKLLPQTFKGAHLTAPGMNLIRCTELSIECADPVPVLVDGEIVATDARSIKVRSLPGAIQVISGATPGPRPARS